MEDQVVLVQFTERLQKAVNNALASSSSVRVNSSPRRRGTSALDAQGGGGGGSSFPEYNGFFKLILETVQSEQGQTEYYVRIVDGATYNPSNNPVSDNSVCMVNGVSFSVPPFRSEKIVRSTWFGLLFTSNGNGNTGQLDGTVKIISQNSDMYNDTRTKVYYLLGRAFVSNGVVEIQQDHCSTSINGITGNGVAQLWWYGVCV